MVMATRRLHIQRRGFTLIEVLVAGIVLAIGMTTLLSITSQALTTQQRGEQTNRRDVVLGIACR